MLNVSRTVVDDCLARYDNDDCEVYFLNVTASEETLTRRLTKRAREPPSLKRSTRADTVMSFICGG